MALIPTIYCQKCATGFALVLKLETCPQCHQPTIWLEESPVPLKPFLITRQDADWLKHARIAVDAADLAI